MTRYEQHQIRLNTIATLSTALAQTPISEQGLRTLILGKLEILLGHEDLVSII